MTPDACSKRVHFFTVAAQYALSQEEIDLVLSDEELDSYHCFVGHHHFVGYLGPATRHWKWKQHPNSETKAKVIVKAADPLAKTGSLYYYHSKTKVYGDWFFWT
jgi:hypothetical protein